MRRQVKRKPTWRLLSFAEGGNQFRQAPIRTRFGPGIADPVHDEVHPARELQPVGRSRRPRLLTQSPGLGGWLRLVEVSSRPLRLAWFSSPDSSSTLFPV